MAFLTRHLHVWVATWGVGLVVTIATSVALAEVVYWTVEVPSMAIGKRAATAVASLWARPPERTVRLATRRPHATS
jgi:peptidoglycan/LPS O-acetylase OafA/YrhL